MILLDYFKLCVSQKFATFSGRARRQEYWLFYLDCLIVSSALSSLSLSLVHNIVANAIVTTISVAWVLFTSSPAWPCLCAASTTRTAAGGGSCCTSCPS